MDFDLSKENIQPLRGGRNVSQLEIALQAQSDTELQRELQQQRGAFEEAIRSYEGDDPLDNWYNYISWVEQSFPKHGHEGNLVPLLEDCLEKFESDERYMHDRRLCKLWIKYIDLQKNPLELFQLLYSKKICASCADLYRAWAYYHEVAGDYKRADAVFQLGLKALAQPYEELVFAHENMFLAIGKEAIQGVDERRLSEQRQALTSLRTYKHNHKTVVPSVRIGNQILQSTPGTLQQSALKNDRSHSANVPVTLYEDLEVAGPSVGAAGASVSVLEVARKQDIVHKENAFKAGTWKKGVVKKVTQHRTPAFKVREDDDPQYAGGIRLPENHYQTNLDNFSDWKTEIFFADPADLNQNHKPMYPKHLVYSDPNTEYSLEEIKARHWFAKKQGSMNEASINMQETMMQDAHITGHPMNVEVALAVQSILPTDNNFPVVNDMTHHQQSKEITNHELIFPPNQSQNEVASSSQSTAHTSHLFYDSSSGAGANVSRNLKQNSRPISNNLGPNLEFSSDEGYTVNTREAIKDINELWKDNSSSVQHSLIEVKKPDITKFQIHENSKLYQPREENPRVSSTRKSIFKITPIPNFDEDPENNHQVQQNRPQFNIYQAPIQPRTPFAPKFQQESTESTFAKRSTTEAFIDDAFARPADIKKPAPSSVFEENNTTCTGNLNSSCNTQIFNMNLNQASTPFKQKLVFNREVSKEVPERGEIKMPDSDISRMQSFKESDGKDCNLLKMLLKKDDTQENVESYTIFNRSLLKQTKNPVDDEKSNQFQQNNYESPMKNQFREMSCNSNDSLQNYSTKQSDKMEVDFNSFQKKVPFQIYQQPESSRMSFASKYPDAQESPQVKRSTTDDVFARPADIFQKNTGACSTNFNDSCNTQTFNMNLYKASTPFGQKTIGIKESTENFQQIKKTLFYKNQDEIIDKESEKREINLSVIFENSKESRYSTSSSSGGVTTLKGTSFHLRETLKVIPESSQSRDIEDSITNHSNIQKNTMFNQQQNDEPASKDLNHSSAKQLKNFTDLFDDDNENIKEPVKFSTNNFESPMKNQLGETSGESLINSPIKSSNKMDVDLNSSQLDLPKAKTQENFLSISYSDPFSSRLISALLEKVNFPNPKYSSQFYQLPSLPRLIGKKEVVCILQEKFYVEKVIGKGAFGCVYKATNISTQQLVALKCQKPAHQWEFYIAKEIRERLSTPYMSNAFMDVTACYISPTTSIIVSDFYKLGSLLDLNNKMKTSTGKGLKELVTIYYASEIITIVNTLHQCKIIHADIKPDNFLVTRMPPEFGYPSLQLIDFGRSIDMSLFPPGTTFKKAVSTDNFICTEMKDGRPWTYQTDIFCVAATIHVLLFDKYMQVQKTGDIWSITQRIPRYMRTDLWKTFFFQMLNIESCDHLPDIVTIKNSFDSIISAHSEELQADMRFVTTKILGR